MQLNIVELDLFPIFDQLKLEEALLRTDSHNWCLINRGSPPAIVMGISQNLEHVVDLNAHQENPIPLIRRYSGGGTVVVEPSTVFLTLILNHDAIDGEPFPKEVLKWTEGLLKPAFHSLKFSLKENDYAIGDKKCGGNAQYFARGRLVHHTSFLFDYTSEYMNLLKMPPKMPLYREARAHKDFLHPLKQHYASPNAFSKAILQALQKRFEINFTPFAEAHNRTKLPHRQASFLLEPVQILDKV